MEFYNVLSMSMGKLNQMEIISSDSSLTDSYGYKNSPSNLKAIYLSDIYLLQDMGHIKKNILDQSLKIFRSQNMVKAMNQCFKLGII